MKKPVDRDSGTTIDISSMSAEEIQKKFYPTSLTAEEKKERTKKKVVKKVIKPIYKPETEGGIAEAAQMVVNAEREYALKKESGEPVVSPQEDEKPAYTNADKQAYILSMLEGTPFTKTYTIVGGKCIVEFREVKDADGDLSHVDLIKLMRELNTESTFLYGRFRFNMGLVLSCTRIELESRGLIWDDDAWWCDVVAEAKKDGAPMPSLYDHYRQLETAIGSEAILLLIKQAYSEFSNLKVALEEASKSENFYSATELDP